MKPCNTEYSTIKLNVREDTFKSSCPVIDSRTEIETELWLWVALYPGYLVMEMERTFWQLLSALNHDHSTQHTFNINLAAAAVRAEQPELSRGLKYG